MKCEHIVHRGTYRQLVKCGRELRFDDVFRTSRGPAFAYLPMPTSPRDADLRPPSDADPASGTVRMRARARETVTPTHAPTPCCEPGCFNLTARGGRCARCELLLETPAHELNRPTARKRGYDARWERRRRRHLEVDPFCRMCDGQKPGNQVDHVIPHRGAKWLFDLEGNLQTLCEHHHSVKTAHERTIPIGIMYPLDLPEPPHVRPTRFLCGPSVPYSLARDGDGAVVDITGPGYPVSEFLMLYLQEETDVRLTLIAGAPRTAERAFWSHVMGCPAELELPMHHAIEGHPAGWWADYMLDQRAEEAMEARSG